MDGVARGIFAKWRFGEANIHQNYIRSFFARHSHRLVGPCRCPDDGVAQRFGLLLNVKRNEELVFDDQDFEFWEE